MNIENIVLTILVVIKKFRLPNKKFSVLDNRPYNLNSMINTMIELKVFDGRVPVDDKLVVAGIVGKDMGLGQLPKPAAGGVVAGDEDFAPLRLCGGLRTGEFDGQRPEGAVVG